MALLCGGKACQGLAGSSISTYRTLLPSGGLRGEARHLQVAAAANPNPQAPIVDANERPAPSNHRVPPSKTMETVGKHFDRRKEWAARGPRAPPDLTSDKLQIATANDAGTMASSLAFMLRSMKTVTVDFDNCRGILKTLKVLAIAHDFLSQHDSTLSFIPSGYALERATGNAHEEDREPEEYMRRKFTLTVWRRALCHPLEVDAKADSTVPMFDFALDARREWKSKAAIAEDMSYSLADLLYGLLVEQPSQGGLAMPSQKVIDGEKGSPAAWKDPQWSGPVLLTADVAQASTLFMALTLFQQRMQLEGLPLDVVVTVYRNTILPRLDGRNGFIFKVLTQHNLQRTSSGSKTWFKARRAEKASKT